MEVEAMRHIAIDQYGNVYDLGEGSPRKHLLELLNRKHAEKMYVDTATTGSKHIGYVIAGKWLRIWQEWTGS